MLDHGLVLMSILCASAAAELRTDLENHPRPDWARPWIDLNGPWRFDFDPEDVGLRERWFESHAYTKKILVPFPWQSARSGVQDIEYNGVAWYERDIVIPRDFGPRVFITFGAIDWSATVWVNGKEAGGHEGGYTPFSLDITDYAIPGETARLTVRAVDHTDADLPTGKQIGWYTRTGGIWQSVYLESRGAAHLTFGHVAPDLERESAKLTAGFLVPEAGTYTLRMQLTDPDGSQRTESARFAAQTGTHTVEHEIPVPKPKLWHPDTPHLYGLELALLDGAGNPLDAVHTYFGMRSVSRGTYGGSNHEYILLNGEPIYLRGALHQSFNPEGIYTHPDDAFIRRDYEKAKEAGLNFLRIHIKTEEPRALYWADKLGVMLMCDVPNFWKKSERSRPAWEATMRGQIARDFNHPAIIAWCNFNETWGIGDGGYDRNWQEWVRDMYLLAKQLDPTRLVEDNSPCYYDHTVTDINSWHFYIDQYERARDHIAQVVEKTFPGSPFNYAEGWKQDTAPLINSEYGGVSAGSGDRDISWVFLFLTNLLRKYEKIGGYVYTELSDIEWEHNGFVNYDRSEKFYGYPAGITLADLQNEDFPVLDCPPYQKVKPGYPVAIPILLSHWSSRDGLVLRTFADGLSIDGRRWDLWIAAREHTVAAKPFTVSEQGVFEFVAPDATGLIHVVTEVLHEGKRVAANYCVVHVDGGADWPASNQFAVRIPVESCSAYQFTGTNVFPPHPPGKIYGTKTGFIEYRVRLPKDLEPDHIAGCSLIAEAGAKADAERLDWPERTRPEDYPQTDGKLWKTDLNISLDGEPITAKTIDNDFADGLGVLSHVAHYHHGSRGEVINAPFGPGALDALKAALRANRPVTLRFEVKPDATHCGGIALYGAGMGQWPSDPALVFELRRGAPKPKLPAKIVDRLETKTATLIKTGPIGHVWLYTTQQPDETWTQPTFADTLWKFGKSGFGTKDTPGARIGTEWSTADIWLRTRIDVPRRFGRSPVWLTLHHDDTARIYVNGKLLLEQEGYVTDYERIQLSPDQIALFQPGKENVIAVHCHQTGGGQFIDLGLHTLERSK